MQIIGITGRSGCGKSTLTDSIRAAGFRCVDADQVAREVLLPGSPCIVQLQQEFGADIVDEAGQVRRHLLADRAFATPQGTARRTAITQPEIYHRLDLAMAEARQAGEKLVQLLRVAPAVAKVNDAVRLLTLHGAHHIVHIAVGIG